MDDVKLEQAAYDRGYAEAEADKTAIFNRAFAKVMERRFKGDLLAGIVNEYIEECKNQEVSYFVGKQSMEVL